MPTPQPLRARVRRAAALFAQGQSFEAIAKVMKVKADLLRRWPRDYAPFWRRAVAEAHRDVLRAATAEALLTLRRHLRSEDDKASRDAAAKIVSYALAAAKRPKRPAKVAATTEAGVWAEVRGMSDAELEALVGELAGFAPQAGAGEPGTGDPPGAP